MKLIMVLETQRAALWKQYNVLSFNGTIRVMVLLRYYLVFCMTYSDTTLPPFISNELQFKVTLSRLLCEHAIESIQ